MLEGRGGNLILVRIGVVRVSGLGVLCWVFVLGDFFWSGGRGGGCIGVFFFGMFIFWSYFECFG